MHLHDVEAFCRQNAIVSKIVTVAAYKGGVGKTTLAMELAYLLEAPLVDLDRALRTLGRHAVAPSRR